MLCPFRTVCCQNISLPREVVYCLIYALRAGVITTGMPVFLLIEDPLCRICLMCMGFVGINEVCFQPHLVARHGKGHACQRGVLKLNAVCRPAAEALPVRSRVGDNNDFLSLRNLCQRIAVRIHRLASDNGQRNIVDNRGDGFCLHDLVALAALSMLLALNPNVRLCIDYPYTFYVFFIYLVVTNSAFFIVLALRFIICPFTIGMLLYFHRSARADMLMIVRRCLRRSPFSEAMVPDGNGTGSYKRVVVVCFCGYCSISCADSGNQAGFFIDLHNLGIAAAVLYGECTDSVNGRYCCIQLPNVSDVHRERLCADGNAGWLYDGAFLYCKHELSTVASGRFLAGLENTEHHSDRVNGLLLRDNLSALYLGILVLKIVNISGVAEFVLSLLSDSPYQRISRDIVRKDRRKVGRKRICLALFKSNIAEIRIIAKNGRA